MNGTLRKRGSKWYYSFEICREDGKRRRYEKVGGNTKKEAAKALRTALMEYENVGSVFKASEYTFEDYLEYWYNNYVLINCKLNTQRAYRLTIDKHLNPVLGKYLLKKISPAKLQELINMKHQNGYSKNYLSSIMGVISGSFKYAIHPCEFIKSNPAEYVTIPKIDSSVNKDNLKIITVDEFDLLIKRFPSGNNFFIPLQLGFHTGMRAGETCALRWSDIDLKTETLSVRHTLIEHENGVYKLGSPKTKSSIRDIKLGPTIVKLLKAHKIHQKENKLHFGRHYHDSDYVCTKNNGVHITTGSLRYVNRVANHKLGITFSYHSLRHTHATLLIESGANMKHVQTRLGHSKLSTTMDTYSHVTNKMITDTIDLFEKRIKLPTT